MKDELDAIVARALYGVMPVLPLRGVDTFAREGGDLDYMVPQRQAVAACRQVAETAIVEGWFLASFRNIGYLAQIVLIRPRSVEPDDALKIDFFDGLCWYGVGSDVAGRRLFDSLALVQSDKVRLAAAACFFQKILIVGQESERDWARVAATGADAAYLEETGRYLDLPITRSQIESRGVTGLNKWRLRAASGGATSVLSAMAWLPRAAVAHLKFKSGLATNAGLILGLSGLDGSGKSTQIDRLISGIRKAGGEPPQLVHLLPNWIPLPHQLLRRKKTQTNYTRPYAEPPVSSRLNGRARLTFYLCAFMLARLSLWFGEKRGRLIIMDRSLLDFAADLTRARIPAYRLPAWLLRALMPTGLLFYLDAAPENVVARKGELSLGKAASLQVSYRKTCNIVGATLLDGDKPSDTVFKELLSHLSREYMQRLADAEARK
jgi:thymidylate kinase